MIRCIPVTSCASCPYAQFHYGQYECAKFNHQPLGDIRISNGIGRQPPVWCPLPPHPSFEPAAQPGGA